MMLDKYQLQMVVLKLRTRRGIAGTTALAYSNKKITSYFHGTVSINPVKISQQNNTKMFIKCRAHKNW